MKRIIYLFLLLSIISGCAVNEDAFQVNGEPYFSINVLDDGSVPLKELAPMSAQYSLEMSANGYSAAENVANHVSKALRFHITTNMRWKIVPTDQENVPDWIHPFPESGDTDGIFFFKTDRNVDPVNARETYYNILVDKGNGVYEPIEGILRVIQEASPEFLEMNAAKFSVAAAGQTIRLRVKSNVPWTYGLSPSEDYATGNLDWIVDESVHPAEQYNDTLVFTVAANDKGMRGASLKINYSLDGVEKSDVVAITQYPETEVYLEGFPVKWLVRVEGNTFADTFPSDGTGTAVSGNGKITFNNECGKAADTNGNVLLDITDNSPRATGVWPGDYCEFVASSPVSAGTIVKIAFATRVSEKGHKYWRLEYRDGDQWKIAGRSFVDEAVEGLDGKPVVYTHAMNPDGATNTLVETAVTYENATDQVEFRFICAANYRANGSGPLAAPNGGTWRLSVDTKDENDPYQPSISIVAAGGEPPVMANVSLSASYLYMEGKPEGAKVFRVTSDQDFTIRPEQPWIHVDKLQESAGENVAISVTCDQNKDEKGREGYITVLAGITRRQIAIVQGTVGGGGTGGEIDLDPFVSIVSGNNVSLNYKKGTAEVKVMSNLALSTEISDSWLSLSIASTETVSTVTTTTYKVTYAENPSAEQERTATIRFYNGNRESVVTFTQDKNISNMTIYFEDDFSWLNPYLEVYKATISTDFILQMDPVLNDIGGANHAPNIWTVKDLAETVGSEFTSIGYVDLNQSETTMYLQDGYLKFCRKNVQTGLQLPPLEFEGNAPVDVIISFDWCAHMSGAGNIDEVPLVISLSGPGSCADTDSSVSREFKTAQTKNNMEWQSASLVLNGVTKDTRISIKPNFSSFFESGNHRWHIDNILIIKK